MHFNSLFSYNYFPLILLDIRIQLLHLLLLHFPPQIIVNLIFFLIPLKLLYLFYFIHFIIRYQITLTFIKFYSLLNLFFFMVF